MEISKLAGLARENAVQARPDIVGAGFKLVAGSAVVEGRFTARGISVGGLSTPMAVAAHFQAIFARDATTSSLTSDTASPCVKLRKLPMVAGRPSR